MKHCSSPARGSLAALVTVVSIVAASVAWGDDRSPDVLDCLPAVGTFLTIRHPTGEDGARHLGRSLISLTNGGHAFFTDSAEGGVGGYQPFSDARGAWRCRSGTDDEIEFTALMLDFTFPTTDDPDQKIARIDIEATFHKASEKLMGHAVVSFVPLAGDPFEPANLQDSVAYDFSGRKIDIPAD